MKIYSNFVPFSERYNKSLTSTKEDDIFALKSYFERGGLIKTNGSQGLSVVYPNKLKISKEVVRIKDELVKINKRIKLWTKTGKDAENYLKNLKIKKFYDKTFWKHTLKSITDKQYKEDFKKTKISTDLIADPKFKKIVNEFMTNLDYRDNLVETLDKSIIYKNRGLGGQIIEGINIKKYIAEKKKTLFSKTRDSLKSQLKAYKLISRWVIE